jgi:DNA-binding protein HU-beta
MTKDELVSAMAETADISKAAADRALKAFIDAVVTSTSKGHKVTLVGFGTFSTSKRNARTGRNPRTGAEIKIPAATVPKFSAGAGFKAAVNKKKK